MKTYKTFLTEADTSDAANAEMAIVYAYNRSKGMTDKEAIDKGKIDKAKWDKVKPKIKKTGKKVVANLGDTGAFMVHAGSSSAGNQYPLGTDPTSKSDLYGTAPQYQFSLKKKGDTGSGAQLMSAASGEASGVLNFAIQHYENNGGDKALANSPEAKNAFNILRKKMKATSRSDMYVYVSKGKRDFNMFWMSKKNPRWAKIEAAAKGKEVDKEGYINDKHYNARVAKFKSGKKVRFTKIGKEHIKKHLKAELGLIGGGVKTTGTEAKNLIKVVGGKLAGESFIKPPKKSDIDAAEAKYLGDTSIKIGTDTTMSAKHLTKVAKSEKTPKVLKQQIVDVINVALQAKGWQEELSEFFNNNSDLKRWIVYEAASGLGKFTGEKSDGKMYKGSQPAVANTMLVFKSDGTIPLNQTVHQYAKDNPNLVDTLSISYKGSGTNRYIKMGISSGVEYDNPSMITEEMSNTLDDIIDMELIKYQGAMYHLEEGFLDTIKGAFKSAKEKMTVMANKAKELLYKLYDAIIEKFINKIIEWSKKGLTYMMSILGYEVGGEVALATPSW